MKSRKGSRSSMRAAVSHKRMLRTGFVRGVASENGRRLGCEHRLVATRDRASHASSRIHRAGQSEGGESSRCGPAGCGRASGRATEFGPSWSSRRDAGTGRAGHTVCDSLQTARRPSRSHCRLPRPTEMAEASVSLWIQLRRWVSTPVDGRVGDGSGRRDSNSGPCAQGRANPNISFGRGIAIVDARGRLRADAAERRHKSATAREIARV